MARNLLHEVELASRCKDCDWQIEDRPEGFGLLLPEVQGFRNVAMVLAVRARYEIAQGKWDDAVSDVADRLRRSAVTSARDRRSSTSWSAAPSPASWTTKWRR